MLAYKKIFDAADGKSIVIASLEWIKTFVDTCFITTTISNKKERKKLANSGPTKKDFNQKMSIKTIYSLQESKCQVL
jgi:hypothetical protein